MKVALLCLLLVGCTLFTGLGERACGEWPYRILSPTTPERLQEEFYVFDLLRFELSPELFRRDDPFNIWTGFFRPGEPIHVVRAGDISGRHVLVTLADDRFWTVVEEVCGG